VIPYVLGYNIQAILLGKMKKNKGYSKDELESSQIIVFPEKTSLKTLNSLFFRLKNTENRSEVVLDLKQIKTPVVLDLEILRYIQKTFRNVKFINSPVNIPFSDAGKSKANGILPRKQYLYKSGIHKNSSPKKGYGFNEKLGNFFVLLADTLFHTARYIRKREGVYPGEILNQFDFMAYKSFPIVSLITFLVGVTISLTSAMQLKLFGADLYLADFVGIAMFRELVPMMVGIIIAGKIGAAITAEIASMTVLEEIDALKTMDVVPEKFLMVPRLIAISMAVPLLVVLADTVGVFGGVIIARLYLGITPGIFLNEMFKVVFFKDFFIGMAKTITFGWAVVIGSGYKGFYVKKSAEEVGRATTESVVLSISLIIILDCLYALILYQ
jgi:phospholipid/cholesterol/gamma-HCH transport system permease protein